MKLDGEALVPIGWVIGGFSGLIAIVFMVTSFMNRVTFRLERIEDKLGIPRYQMDASLEKKAVADDGR